MSTTGHGRLTTRLALAIGATLCMTVVVTSHAPAQAADPHQLAFGAFAQPQSGQTQAQAVTALETQVGRKLEVVRVFKLWQDTFPDTFDQFLRTGDRTPIMSIKPKRSNGTIITWSSIATAAPGSQLDTEMRSWADRVRDFGAPIYITLHHEPEAGANTSYGTNTTYIAAWQHWVDVFRQEGATNARFMWITTDYGQEVASSDRRYSPKWYPGDDYVDSMAIDAYNWFTCRSNQDIAWRPLATIIEPFRKFGALHPTKKLWLAEWNSTEDPAVSGRKGQWIDAAKALFAGPNYSQFAGVSYFNSISGPGAFQNCTGRVDSSASSLASFISMANDPLYAGDAFGVPTTPPDPMPPVAAFTSSCAGLSCTFTDGSTDSDGTIASREWDFDDGTTSAATSPLHDFAAADTYTISLTVTDDDGQTSTVAHNVAVTVATPSQAPAFRAANSANGTSTSASVQVPGTVVEGDRLIFIVTANLQTTATTPSGWTLVGNQTDGTPDMHSWVFTRAAAANSANSTVTSTLAVSGKSSRILLAYSAAGTPTASSSVQGASSASHSTPAATVAVDSRVIAYWSEKSNDATGWTLPAQVQSRATSIGTSGGRINAAAGDAAAVNSSWPAVTATSTAASTKAIMWTVVVPPAGPPPANQSPTAGFASSCTGLSCSFTSTSSDPDGTIASTSWTFDDGSTASGPTASHTYLADGTYPVTVSVTDNSGTTASANRDIAVSAPVGSAITFVAQAAANANTTSHRVVVPASVQPGDGLILAFTSSTTATVGTPAGVTGWRLLGTRSNSGISTSMWTKVAAAGNAGAAITISTSTVSKGNFVIAAYRGTSTADPVASFASSLETTSRTTHTTPSVQVTSDQSWVVWYWAQKDSSTTAFVAPPDTTVRSNTSQSGGGRITGLLADTNAPAGIGTVAGKTATAGAASSSATQWSIVLAPA